MKIDFHLFQSTENASVATASRSGIGDMNVAVFAFSLVANRSISGTNALSQIQRNDVESSDHSDERGLLRDRPSATTFLTPAI